MRSYLKIPGLIGKMFVSSGEIELMAILSRGNGNS
jgi:hypothetical protein